jgi:hypothetical protein
MSYEDILEIQKQRQEQDARGLKRNPSSSVSWRQRSHVCKKSKQPSAKFRRQEWKPSVQCFDC